MTDTQRLETLELKCMDLENTVQALNDQLIQQYQDFQRFTREIERLEIGVDEAKTVIATVKGLTHEYVFQWTMTKGMKGEAKRARIDNFLGIQYQRPQERK